MTILSDSTLTVNPAPRTFVPSQADLDWAAQTFGDAESDRELAALEERAEQARWDDQFRFPAGICEMCGEPSDWLDPVHKLCGECLTVAEDATIAGVNERAGLGYRVF
jgi:hypothetical protein